MSDWGGLRGRPHTEAEARRAIEAVLGVHPGDEAWRRASIERTHALTHADLHTEHPVLSTLIELDRAWHNSGDAARFEHIHGHDTTSLLQAIGLGMRDDDEYWSHGASSDFDPLNATEALAVDGESTWFSLVSLPGDACAKWPVVWCEPMGDENVCFCALDLEDFLIHHLCEENGNLDTDDRDSALLVLNHLRTRFGFDLDLAIAAWDCEHTEKYRHEGHAEADLSSLAEILGEDFVRQATSERAARDAHKLERPDFAPSYDGDLLKPLERLLVLPDR